MYLHLGRDVATSEREIIGIFDLDTTSYGKRTREFLAAQEKAGQVENVSDELPKSFVLCGRRGKTRLYLSQLSSATLKGRMDQGPFSTYERKK